MKFIILILLCCFVHFLGAQENSPSRRIGLGYGPIHAGAGDIPGQVYYLFAQFPTKNRSISFNVRVSGTHIEQTTYYGSHKIFEKSNGVNLETDVNLHYRIWRIDLYPSVGPSIRFASNQRMHSARIIYNPLGSIIDFDIGYYGSNNLYFGYSIALNMELTISKRFTLGTRISGSDYINGSKLSYASVLVTYSLCRK